MPLTTSAQTEGLVPPVKDGTKVLSSAPVATSIVEAPQMQVVPEIPGTVPDVRGLSARDATRKLLQAGMSVRLSGDGFVIDQEPAPGGPIVQDGEGRLILTRAAVRSAAITAQP